MDTRLKPWTLARLLGEVPVYAVWESRNLCGASLKSGTPCAVLRTDPSGSPVLEPGPSLSHDALGSSEM